MHAKAIKLKNFRLKIQYACSICDKRINDFSTIRISTTDAGRRYKGSNRKFLNHYKIECCDTCFKKTMTKINNIIINQ